MKGREGEECCAARSRDAEKGGSAAPTSTKYVGVEVRDVDVNVKS